MITSFLTKYNELKAERESLKNETEGEGQGAAEDDQKDSKAETGAGGKKKFRCTCKKRCKGICKKQKIAAPKQVKEEEKVEETLEEEKESIELNIPFFPGRKNLGDGGINRDVKIEGVTVAFSGSNILLDHTSINLNWGQRYGLIGPNGCGKSALMKALASRELKFQKGLMIYMVEEEAKPSDMTALQAVLSADTERAALIKRLDEESKKEQSDVHVVTKINSRLEEIDSDTAEARSAEILSGLGFTKEMQDK